MSEVGSKERITQNRIIKLFQHHLHYNYLGNWKDRKNNRNLEPDYLHPFLKQQGYSDTLIKKAIAQFNKTVTNQNQTLYELNKTVYSSLRYGVKIKPEIGANTETVWLIDWNHPENNHFGIAEEVTIKGENKKRPDIVLYINGIALGILELKRSTVSVSEGIRQNLDNQQSHFIQPFFATIQLIMAGNDTQGLRYGTIETPEKYYLTWKEDSDIENPLERSLSQLCTKERLLEIIHDFIVFDKGKKKLCRHNQYFGVKNAQNYIKNREGGIIWHTQGSGKSLTMVWLAKWIREYNPNARILIVTDRDELDKQVESVFSGVEEQITSTQSGKDLINKLNQTTPSLMCSLIHKFGRNQKADYDNYIEELKSNLPPDFQAKGEIYVFVDECHRTQSGKLHQAMKEILPHTLFIGFTGTPLLKKDKQKSIEVFGKYIHTYKFDEAAGDKVVLDLRYEARQVNQQITSPHKIDQWFDIQTQGLTEHAKTELKKRWGTMQKLLSSKSRLEKIVADIIFDFATKDRLKSGRGNAMLVAGSIYEACKYYELFQNQGFTKCAIITSYEPSAKDIKGETTGEDERTEKLRQYEIYNRMLGGKDPAKFEDEVKEQFVKNPAQMKLLIVVDKLLTGFDAPSATYLYIDKTMRDHGLFQAICRVNRLDGEDKEYGYIIDYQDLFKSLEKSITDYTSEALENFDRADIKDLLSDRLETAKDRLKEMLEQIRILCEPVAPPKDTPAYIRYFCGSHEPNQDQLKANEHKRHDLYKYTASLVRAYANLANDMIKVGYTPQDASQIKAKVKHYEQARQAVKLASGDYIDLKSYEPAMRHLIDTYIGAEDSAKITALDDLTLVQLIVQRGKEALDYLPQGIKENPEAVAETIENNLRKIITDEQPTNPKYYEQMSELLEQLIEDRKQEAQDYETYLKQITELSKQVIQPNQSSNYPAPLDTAAKRALYDNLDQDEALALAIDQAIKTTKKDGWRGNRIKERQVRRAIKQHIDNEDTLNRIFELAKKQNDY
ncbi:type I site-specific deoxyribonuclease, HsdR family [Halothece sp. PCC 7418]|uniref:type I restriction endonuclease subunit R n=1 Tax=Halothece sp. (strain PCC 7418) TaxID=65093 RepID=UPI0002A06331|nr:HsdR family type I site-specific deoxyribonuclease [Halothece sp. PCC 7418]AFZ45145.1 type I site-specific deoxyribonuclease, HsdR family [Halothece sp. PCC 7418]